MEEGHYLIERERRFFVDGRNAKPWRGEQAIAIVQHYLQSESLALNESILECDGKTLFSLTEDERILFRDQAGWGARLRKTNEAFFFTSKTTKNDDTRYELEREISESTYRELLKDHHHPHIMKTRYLWADAQGLTWEVDEYEGMFAGLVVAEVELNEGQRIDEVPPWAGQEITGLGVLSNHSLAMLAEQLRP